MSKGPGKQRANGVGMKHSQPSENGEGPTLRHSDQQIAMMKMLYGKELPQSHQDLVAMGGFNREKTKG